MIEQRTPEWHAARLGVFTSSDIWKIMNQGKKDVFTETGNAYIMEKAAERLTGQRVEIRTTEAMQWGIDNEPIAKKALAANYGWEIFENEFVKHPELNYGGSGDGWIRDVNAALEVKCLSTVNHLKEISISAEGLKSIKKELPERYWQVTSDALLRGCENCALAWFDPRLPNRNGLIIHQFKLDPMDVNHILSRVQLAEEKFNSLLEKFK